MDASLHGAVPEIPPFNGWCSNVARNPGCGQCLAGSLISGLPKSNGRSTKVS